VLEPLLPLKQKLIAFTNMENYSPWGAADDAGQSHGRRPGCF
jgi:hypothetical protein